MTSVFVAALVIVFLVTLYLDLRDFRRLNKQNTATKEPSNG